MTVVALASLSLTACAGSGASYDTDNRLAIVPGDVKVCIYKLVPKPQEIKTKKQIAKVISDLKKSEAAKTDCGKRLINLYESQSWLH